MKACNKCLTSKSFDQFHKNKRSPDGHDHRCKGCRKTIDSVRYGINKDAITTRNKNYNSLNLEKVKARLAKYSASDAEKLRKQKYTDENREKVRATKRAYKLRNVDKRRADKAKRRALQLLAMPKWADICAIKSIYEEAKALSDLLGETYHVDHIVPLRGRTVCGLHVHFNLQPIRAIDNVRKGNKLLDDTVTYRLT